MSELIEKIACKDYNNVSLPSNTFPLCSIIPTLLNYRNFQVFAKPVTEKEVPGYATVIKNPMDLSTMRRLSFVTSLVD